MGKNPEGMIKKAISETIAEEMFRDLGFFVLRLGQENTLNPITQLNDFIAGCGGNFQLKYGGPSVDFIRRLPDFVIIDKFGRVQFIEVKYSKGGYLNEERRKVFLNIQQ